MDFSILGIKQLQDDLQLYKAQCLTTTSNENPEIEKICQHLISAEGKNLRPGLTLLTSYAIENKPAPIQIIKAATAIELVHVGSLHHDDVIDSSKMRRGKNSINQEWDNKTAILSGDYLLGKASELATEINVEVAKSLSKTISSLCTGQLLELFDLNNVNRTKENYLKTIEGKTASLFATSCMLGTTAHPINTELNIEKAFSDYGYNLGMCFQLLDDILDYTQDSSNLGKPAGKDLIEGNLSLPAILSIEENLDIGILIKDIFTNENKIEIKEIENIVNKINDTNAIDQTKLLAKQYCEESIRSIDNISKKIDNEIYIKLKTIVEYLLERTK
jgi:heptaprenyl diphosphate synthase